MNGNRGAKGSVKDRLISLLYRERYKKNKVKEEEYTIKNKTRKKEYLNTLSSFEEKENIDVLDQVDRNKVNEFLNKSVVKVNQEVLEDKKVEERQVLKNGNVERKNSRVIINRRPVGVPSVNQKTNFGQFQKVELKKEIKKTKAEITILSEVSNFIKTSKENLNEINKQVKEIKTDIKNKNQDITLIEAKQKKLKEKINKLKTQYDIIKNKYDLSEFKILESIKLMESIDDYKTLARLNEIEMMVNVCKKEFDSIKSVEVVSNNSKKASENIDNIKQDQTKVKIKFIKSKEKTNNISVLEEQVKYELEQQKKIVDEMYSKASLIDQELIKTTEYIGKRKILSSLFRITAGMLTINYSDKKLFGIALGATLINRGLKDLNKSYEKREKIKINLKYEDLTNKLNSVSDLLSYTSLMLIDSMNEVNKLKANFMNEYKEYSNILPNYNDTLNMLDDLSNKIKENQEKLSKMNKKVEQEKEMNQKKLVKVKELQSKY